MVQIAGKYKCYKNENFAEFLVAMGYPGDKAKVSGNDMTNLELQFDGKKIVVSSSGASNTSNTLVLNEGVDETIGPVTFKSTAVLAGDVLTITSVKDDKKLVRTYKFTDNEIVLTMTESSSGGITAKRFYKRV